MASNPQTKMTDPSKSWFGTAGGFVGLIYGYEIREFLGAFIGMIIGAYIGYIVENILLKILMMLTAIITLMIRTGLWRIF